MKNLEIWLCKVLLHAHTQKPLNLRVMSGDEPVEQAVLAKIINGEIGSLPDGTIIEPITAHATEPEANEARERAVHDDPKGDYRVVVTMRVDGGFR